MAKKMLIGILACMLVFAFAACDNAAQPVEVTNWPSVSMPSFTKQPTKSGSDWVASIEAEDSANIASSGSIYAKIQGKNMLVDISGEVSQAYDMDNDEMDVSIAETDLVTDIESFYGALTGAQKVQVGFSVMNYSSGTETFVWSDVFTVSF